MFNPERLVSPAEWALPYDDIFIETSDNIYIHAWLLLHDSSYKHPTIIYFHGNAGNIGLRIPNAYDMFHKLGANVLLLDYRGYGNSQGVPSEPGLTIDAIAALDYLITRDEIDPATIIVFGRSLGGAVALKLASLRQNHIAAVVVENTFSAIDDMVMVLAARFSLPRTDLLRIPLSFFISSHWNNKSHVSQLTIPILFISGQQDELIPPEQMQAVYDAAALCEHRTLLKYQGGHNDTFVQAGEQYYRDMKLFLDRHKS